VADINDMDFHYLLLKIVKKKMLKRDRMKFHTVSLLKFHAPVFRNHYDMEIQQL